MNSKCAKSIKYSRDGKCPSWCHCWAKDADEIMAKLDAEWIANGTLVSKAVTQARETK